MHQVLSVKATQSCGLRGIFSPSLKSNNEGKIKKRWSTYPSLLCAGAAAHVLSSFVAKQRHTGLELVGGVWHRKMRVGSVTGFQSESGR